MKELLVKRIKIPERVLRKRGRKPKSPVDSLSSTDAVNAVLKP